MRGFGTQQPLHTERMHRFAAGALVFFTSAAVLVLEILAARLLAPYVGVTLETYTAIIGTILAAIAIGTYVGGRLADRFNPRQMLGPTLILGGALALFIVPIVRIVGSYNLGHGPEAVLTLAFIGFFAPAAVLSAVPPTVVKLALLDLNKTGSTVGRLSALGTTGAIFGTFATGFILVAALPTTPIILTVSALLIGAGIVTVIFLKQSASPPLTGPLAITIILLAPLAAGAYAFERNHDPCDVESTYFCASVVKDAVSCQDGLTLMLDTLRHSCVHPGNPTRLDFPYARTIADVIAAAEPAGRPLTVLHIGGGGFTLPRYLEAVRPGSQSVVLELDKTLVDIAREQLGLRTSDALQVHVGDARVGILGQPSDTFDVVIGDAFGGLAVPWHLATREFIEQVDRVLTPTGVYVANVIDYPPLGFVRAEAATFNSVFQHVAVIGSPAKLAGQAGGNFILVGSAEPIDEARIIEISEARGDEFRAVMGADLDAFIGDGRMLTDDYAPVDQLLTVPAFQ